MWLIIFQILENVLKEIILKCYILVTPWSFILEGHPKLSQCGED